MMFLWLPLLFLIPFAMFWMVRSGSGVGCCGVTQSSDAQPPSTAGQDPIEIARQRLARGEITTVQFEELRRVLG